ncbi:hypothetical protein AMTRI_Chr02g221950 [Amborella trichopoda]
MVESMAQILMLFTISIFSYLCSPSSGIKVTLIHGDDPKSPFYNPKASEYELFQQAFDRSVARYKYLSSLATGEYSPTALRAFMQSIPGEFLMTIGGIGSPATEYQLLFDSGRHVDTMPAVLSVLPPASPSLQPLQVIDRSLANHPSGGSHRHGMPFYDSVQQWILFLILQVELKSVLMEPKCRDMPSVYAGGSFVRLPAGIIPFEEGMLSFRFAYCIMLRGNSIMEFGNQADIPKGQGLSISIHRLSTNPSIAGYLTCHRHQYSGTSVTRMNETVFKMIGMKISSSTPVPDPAKRYEYCYRINEPVDVFALPSITFHFDNNVSWRNPPEGLYGFSAKNVGTLAHHKLVEHDYGMERLSFQPADCSKIK